jgi:MFS family permease
MNKPVYGMLLGGFLGIFDGLSALVSAPETAPMIISIVVGSTFKGLVAGVLIGWFARKVQSTQKGILFGLVIGAFFAFLIAAMPNPDGSHYWWQIILPGSILGVIVGYATQRHSPRRTAV